MKFPAASGWGIKIIINSVWEREKGNE